MIGECAWRALLSFQCLPEPLNLRSRTSKDWPAFLASGTKSVRQFENGYVDVSVEAHGTILELRATLLSQKSPELYAGGDLSMACEFDDLGARIRELSRDRLLLAAR